MSSATGPPTNQPPIHPIKPQQSPDPPPPTAPAAAPSQGHGSTPSDFLHDVLGRPVVVKLNSAIEYRGILACLDGYMNIALEQTEEYHDGQLKNTYGDAFIRGNNVLYISAAKTR